MAMRAQREPLAAATFAALEDKGSTMTIAMSDGFESELRVHRPTSAPARAHGRGSPLVVLIYGGGFVAGDNRQLSPYAGALARLYGATVVNISYRLAPEHRFPAAPSDAWDTLAWLARNAGSLGADARAGFVVGGVSAGANLAAVTAQRWADERREPRLTAAWLSIPLLFEAALVPDEYRGAWLSREQNADADVINEEAMRYIVAHTRVDVGSPLFSPVNSASADRHASMPPRVYFQVCGQDPLRDDGLVYERMLRAAGVRTRLDVYPGVPHAHFSFMPALKSSRKAQADTVENFAWLLDCDSPSEGTVRDSVSAPGSG